MNLYHGSPFKNLKQLIIGEDNKQGRGVYLTSSKDQAKYFAQYGSIYKVELSDCSLLDYSNIELMNELFKELLNDELITYELECLSNGSGNFLKLMNLISANQKEIIQKRLEKYNVHKIKSLGYRGEYNYIVKDESIIKIIAEEVL